MNIMKMMQQMGKIQENMEAAKQKLEALEVSAQSGAGMVSVTMNGKMKATSIKISPEAMEENDPTLLEDLILAALEEARQKAKAAAEKEMSEATGGISLPGGFPFGG